MSYTRRHSTNVCPGNRVRYIKNALARASKTTRNLRWFEVTEVRGRIDDGDVAQWQVAVKVSFALD